MKRVYVPATLAVAMLCVSSAWAQFGLYGAPELLRLPPVQQSSDEGVSQFGRAPSPLPPATASEGRMPWQQNTPAAFVPDDPGYTQEIMRPVIETPVAPIPEIPSLGDTFLGSAPADTVKKPPKKPPQKPVKKPPPLPQKAKPNPQPVPELGVGDQEISRMLRESGCYEPNPWTEEPVDPECDSTQCAPLEPCFRSPWFVGVSGLVMERDQPNRVWTTYQTTDQANQLMHTNDIILGSEAGGEITFGRRFCCDAWSVQATYWSLNAFSGFASQTAVGGVSTPLDFTDVIYANGALSALNPANLFDNSQEHRLWRTNELHNIEINLVRNHVDLYLGDSGICNRLSVDWMIGARFLRFEEDLTFGSLEAGAYTWAADPDRQGFLQDQCTNNLAGFQFGCDVDFTVWHGCRLFLKPKIGIYNNHIRNSFMAYRGDGELFAPDPTPPQGSPVPGNYPVNATVDALSFLTEINLGLDWQFLPKWTFTAGYRVMIATGMGLADNQIPFYIVDIPELADIDHNGQLVLHGVFSGVEFNY